MPLFQRIWKKITDFRKEIEIEDSTEKMLGKPKCSFYTDEETGDIVAELLLSDVAFNELQSPLKYIKQCISDQLISLKKANKQSASTIKDLSAKKKLLATGKIIPDGEKVINYGTQYDRKTVGDTCYANGKYKVYKIKPPQTRGSKI